MSVLPVVAVRITVTPATSPRMAQMCPESSDGSGDSTISYDLTFDREDACFRGIQPARGDFAESDVTFAFTGGLWHLTRDDSGSVIVKTPERNMEPVDAKKPGCVFSFKFLEEATS